MTCDQEIRGLMRSADIVSERIVQCRTDMKPSSLNVLTTQERRFAGANKRSLNIDSSCHLEPHCHPKLLSGAKATTLHASSWLGTHLPLRGDGGAPSDETRDEITCPENTLF